MCAVSNMAVFCSYLLSYFPYIVQLFYEWFWDSPSCPYYYWLQLFFYIPHELYFYCKVFSYILDSSRPIIIIIIIIVIVNVSLKGRL
jgi:hypothetical protein